MRQNILTGVITISIAATTAFDSFLIPETVYVKAVLAHGAQWECYDTQVSCEAQGTSICVVYIPLRNGSSIVASSAPATGQAFAYRAYCSEVLRSNSYEDHFAPLTGNDRPIHVRYD